MLVTPSADPGPQIGPPRLLAQALIRSLTRGTAISEGVRYIHVGHEKWLAAQREVLREIAEDGHADTKFVRGAYGAGKSHFLSMVQDLARGDGWATSHIECKVDGVQIDRFETLYPRIASKLTAADLSASPSEAADGPPDAILFVLEKWAREQARRSGIREGGLTRPFDADARVHAHLEKGLLRSSLPPDFVRALTVFARAHLAHDTESMMSVSSWMGGANEWASLPCLYLQRPAMRTADAGRFDLRPIGKGTARDAMRGLLWLVRSAGYSGLVLCIDEIEELAKLGNKKRQDQALQALREFVDHAGGEGGFRNLCMYLAATPDMFEGEHYFLRYDALATRIQAVSSEINWRSPVIDLDRTPLKTAELRTMALRIRDVHRSAYQNTSRREVLSDGAIQSLLDNVLEAKFRIAKPRLLARVIVDTLERSRQDAIEAPNDFRALVNDAASGISKDLDA